MAQATAPAAQPPRVVLVTGASSGVGAAVARQLAAEGACVAINYRRDRELAEAVARDCRALGGQALVLAGDVAIEADAEALVAQTVAHWGRLDGLVNSAGVTQFVPMQALDALNAADFQRIYGVNAVGAFQMCRAAARHMGQGGAIVNISSVAAQTGSGSSLPYVMSKAALNAMTLGLARALAPRIRVNAVLPGMVEGRWMRDGLGEAAYQQVKAAYAHTAALGRIATPEDIADAVCWLLRPGSAVTGQLMVVDAGFLLGKLPSATGPSSDSPARS